MFTELFFGITICLHFLYIVASSVVIGNKLIDKLNDASWFCCIFLIMACGILTPYGAYKYGEHISASNSNEVKQVTAEYECKMLDMELYNFNPSANLNSILCRDKNGELKVVDVEF